MNKGKLTRNKNLKTISVSNALDLNRIPCKILAPYEAWLDLQKVFEDAFIENKPVSLKTIEPYLKASTKSRQALREFHKEAPDELAWHFYHFFIREANLINPLNKRAVKERGRNPYGLTGLQMHHIRMTARHLYIFLYYWLKQDKKKYPAAVKAFFEKHNITSNDAVSETMRIIAERLNFDINGIDDIKTFYNKYIAYQELNTLRKAYQQINYLPIREPLKSL